MPFSVRLCSICAPSRSLSFPPSLSPSIRCSLWRGVRHSGASAVLIARATVATRDLSLSRTLPLALPASLVRGGQDSFFKRTVSAPVSGVTPPGSGCPRCPVDVDCCEWALFSLPVMASTQNSKNGASRHGFHSFVLYPSGIQSRILDILSGSAWRG